MTPPLGTKVRVVGGTPGDTERQLCLFPQRVYTVLRYTGHGYAEIAEVGGAPLLDRYLVHPEALEPVEPPARTFRLHWHDGSESLVTGPTIAQAMTAAGYGNGALAALDYWREE